MGCYNGTCGLTNLPIRNGDKIVLFIMRFHARRGEGGGGIVYPTDLYSPVTLPLYGEYNDYGGIENITRNGEEVFEHFTKSVSKELYHPLEINEDELKRMHLDGKPKDIDELVNNYIERGVYENIGFMMVLESVLDKIKEHKEDEIELLKNDAHKFVQIFTKEYKEDMYLSDYEDLPGLGWNNSFARFWRIGEGSYYSFKRPFINKLYAMDVDAKNEMIDSLTDLITVQRVLDRTRKFWTVQSGAGSQAENYEDLVMLSNIIIEREIEVKKEWEEENY